MRWTTVEIDLAVALVGEYQEAMAARHRNEPREIGLVSDRALRVRWRGDEKCNGALEQRFVDGVEVGQEAGLARGRQIDRLAAGRGRTRRIGGIERIGDQDRG